MNGDLEDMNQRSFDFDEEGSYFGGYASVGINLALGRGIRVGPEIGVIGGWGDGEFGWTAQFSWNLNIDF